MGGGVAAGGAAVQWLEGKRQVLKGISGHNSSGAAGGLRGDFWLCEDLCRKNFEVMLQLEGNPSPHQLLHLGLLTTEQNTTNVPVLVQTTPNEHRGRHANVVDASARGGLCSDVQTKMLTSEALQLLKLAETGNKR